MEIKSYPGIENRIAEHERVSGFGTSFLDVKDGLCYDMLHSDFKVIGLLKCFSI